MPKKAPRKQSRNTQQQATNTQQQVARFKAGQVKPEDVNILQINVKRIRHNDVDYYLPHDFLSDAGKQRRNVSKRLDAFLDRVELANCKYITFGNQKYIDGHALKLFMLHNHWDLKKSICDKLMNCISSMAPEIEVPAVANEPVQPSQIANDGIAAYTEEMNRILGSYDADRIESEFKLDHKDEFKNIDPSVLHLDVAFKDVEGKKDAFLNRNNTIPHTARFEKLKKRQREKTREFFSKISALSLVMGSNFFVNLSYLFKTHKYVFKFFLKEFVAKSVVNLKFARCVLDQEQEIMISAEKMLFLKDEIRLSDKKYSRMYNFLDLAGVFPAPNLVFTRRRQIDQITFHHFGFHQVRDGWVLQPKPLLEAAVSVLEDCIEISLKQREEAGDKGKTHEAIGSLSDGLLIKNTEDACEIDGEAHTFNGYQVVVPQVISPKNPLSWFFAGVLHVGETKENIKVNFDCFKEFNRLCNSIKGKKEYKAFLIWVSDLASLVKQCGDALDGQNPCFKCWFSSLVKKLFFFRYKFREITTGLGYVTKQIFICVLHMFQRLTEKLIFYTSKGGDLEKKAILMEIFQQNWELSNIKFVVDKKGNEDDVGYDPNNQNLRERVTMCTGNAVNALSKKPDLLKPAFSDSFREGFIWKIMSKTWKFCHVSYTHYSDENLRVLMGMNELISFLIPTAYDLELGVPHYLHYLYHLPDFMIILRDLGVSLSMVDQSGFELSNIVFDHVYHECICRKPTFKRISEAYRRRLEKTNQFIYEDHLVFPQNNSQEEKKRYAKSFQSLSTLLVATRRLTLCMEYKFPYLQLPNYNRKKAKNVKSVDVQEEIDLDQDDAESEAQPIQENEEQSGNIAQLLNSDNEDEEDIWQSNHDENEEEEQEEDNNECNDDVFEQMDVESDEQPCQYDISILQTIFELPPVEEESEKEKKRVIEEGRRKLFLERQKFLPEKGKVHPLLQEFIQFAVSPQELREYINNQTADAYDDHDVQDFIKKLPTSVVMEKPKHPVQFMHPEVLISQQNSSSADNDANSSTPNPRKRRRVECSDLIADGYSEDNEQCIVPFLAQDYAVRNLTSVAEVNSNLGNISISDSQPDALAQLQQLFPQIHSSNLAILQQLTQGNTQTVPFSISNNFLGAINNNNTPATNNYTEFFNNWISNQTQHEENVENLSIPIAQYFTTHSFMN